MPEKPLHLSNPPEGYVLVDKPVQLRNDKTEVIHYWRRAEEGEVDPTTTMRESLAVAFHWVLETDEFRNDNDEMVPASEEERNYVIGELYHYAINHNVPHAVIDEAFAIAQVEGEKQS